MANVFTDLRPMKKVYFISLLIISCVSFFFAYKYFKEGQKEYAWGLGGLGTLSFFYSLYVLLNPDSAKTCDAKLWKVRKNVILPKDIGDPDKTDVSLCEAQRYVQYESKDPGFYFDGSNVFTVSDLESRITTSTSNTNVSFYYLKDETIKVTTPPTQTTTSGTSPTTATTSPTTATTSGTSPACCFRNQNDACITFEQTFLGNMLNSVETFKNFFVTRAGGNYGSKVYLGDFTILNTATNTTEFVYEKPTESSPPTSTEPIKELSSFSWSSCTPSYIQTMKPKILSTIQPQYEKIVKIDTWLVKSLVDHFIYLARNGSPNSFYPIRDGPWRSAMEIKGDYQTEPTIRYNQVTYSGMRAISTSLRNILITE